MITAAERLGEGDLGLQAGVRQLQLDVALAQQGAEKAMKANSHLLAGLNVYKHTLTYKAVADAQGLPCKSAQSVLAA